MLKNILGSIAKIKIKTIDKLWNGEKIIFLSKNINPKINIKTALKNDGGELMKIR